MNPCLLIYHYHYRPGGVRSVIERLLCQWAEAGRWERIVLVGGEMPEAGWLERLRKQVGRVDVRVDARLGYRSEGAKGTVAELATLLEQWFREFPPSLVWAHNLCVGRNAPLGEALALATASAGMPLLSHHHDWWVQGRWGRWAEFNLTWEQAANATLPDAPHIRHACAHPADAALLQSFWGNRVAWVVPPAPEIPPAAPSSLPPDSFWLSPCRILRRKNLLESIALTRWHRPHGQLLISGTASSAAEADYAQSVEEGARLVGLRLECGASARQPMPVLMRGAEMIVQSSLQEGFGLAPWEAALFHRPMLLRRLPALTTAFEQAGAALPGVYQELLLPENFLSAAEQARQLQGWQRPAAALPEPHRSAALALCERPGPPAFSSLTLRGQMEALSDWPRLQHALASANPWLHHPPSTTPVTAPQWPDAGVPQIERLLAVPTAPGSAAASSAEVQTALFHAALPTLRQFPLLW